MPVFFLLMRLHIFKGGPIHKNIILASSGSLASSFIYLLNTLYGKIMIKPVNQLLWSSVFFGSEESIWCEIINSFLDSHKKKCTLLSNVL